MTGKSWKRSCFSPGGTNNSPAGAQCPCHGRTKRNNTALPSLNVLSHLVVLTMVIQSVFLVVIS